MCIISYGESLTYIQKSYVASQQTIPLPTVIEK